MSGQQPMTRCNIITDVVTDVQRQDMDPRIENLRRGPVDQSYIGGLDIQEHEAEYQTEWFALRQSLITLCRSLSIETN